MRAFLYVAADLVLAGLVLGFAIGVAGQIVRELWGRES